MRRSFLLTSCLLFVAARPALSGPAIPWKDCLAQPGAWYASADAIRIADNVLLYQRRTGGWPKNIDMAAPLSPADQARVVDEKDQADSTIDNAATYPQLRYLGRVFVASRLGRFRAPILAGLDYLFASQYSNGGWPQFYPLRPNYSRHITYNDDAMIGVMRLLEDVAAGRAPFEWVDAARRQQASRAVARGIDLILRTQVRVNGRLTAWCAQHDEKTLEPVGARTYEHASLSGRESVAIVQYLMGIDKPDARVTAAIEAAVAWFRSARITGIRIDRRPAADRAARPDAIVEHDDNASPLWARFYEIGTNRPIFSGRDGVVKYRLSEIEFERRANYSWYGDWPADLLSKDYPDWKKRTGSQP